MADLRQRSPRVEHPAYLAYVRTLPCTVSRRPPPSDAAHLRSGSPRHGKRPTGMQEKPDDCWTLPLCREMHEEQHRHGDELAWWALHGIPDPFAVAMALYDSRPAMPPPRAPRPASARPVKARKPPSDRTPIPTRPTTWPKRELRSRNNLRKEPTA